ncbi:MAG: hypothetical protein ACRDH9_02795 [Actinomycetota bacterium]
MSRLFWIGVGVVGAYYAGRWIKRKRQQMSLPAMGANLGDVIADAGNLLGKVLDEARRASAEKEAELRKMLDG